jgi:hypothetical protein
MWKELNVADVKCVDDSSKAKGVTILCGTGSYVSLIFDKAIPHKETDELARLLEKMKLAKVVVEIP